MFLKFDNDNVFARNWLYFKIPTKSVIVVDVLGCWNDKIIVVTEIQKNTKIIKLL